MDNSSRCLRCVFGLSGSSISDFGADSCRNGPGNVNPGVGSRISPVLSVFAGGVLHSTFGREGLTISFRRPSRKARASLCGRQAKPPLVRDKTNVQFEGTYTWQYTPGLQLVATLFHVPGNDETSPTRKNEEKCLRPAASGKFFSLKKPELLGSALLNCDDMLRGDVLCGSH